jgi:phage/conjugal plasmid C-4 type zinc finger TraR family protein
MADDVIETTRTKTNNRVRRLLNAQLDDIAARLQTEAEVPKVGVAGGNFLDVAQDVEHQELARLSASRLTERAKRLQIALTRVSKGEYGVCSECGASIPPKRLLAVPDATTCRACQEQLEYRGAAARASQNDVID